jgi:L-lactate utilization protein LutC
MATPAEGADVGAASASYAQSASGTIQIFQSTEGVQISSVWATSEYGALLQNQNVTGAVLNLTNGAGQVVSSTPTPWPWGPF